MLQWKLVPQIRLVPGIVNVDIYGGKLETFEVQVSPERMQAEGVTLPEIFNAIQSNTTTRGAYIEGGSEQEIVRGLALARMRQTLPPSRSKRRPPAACRSPWAMWPMCGWRRGSSLAR